LKIALAGFGNCKNVTVAECCDNTVAGIAHLGQAKNNHDPARLVIALEPRTGGEGIVEIGGATIIIGRSLSKKRNSTSR
jgi:hypothetical protein